MSARELPPIRLVDWIPVLLGAAFLGGLGFAYWSRGEAPDAHAKCVAQAARDARTDLGLRLLVAECDRQHPIGAAIERVPRHD